MGGVNALLKIVENAIKTGLGQTLTFLMQNAFLHSDQVGRLV
jgi:hypothetical protein